MRRGQPPPEGCDSCERIREFRGSAIPEYVSLGMETLWPESLCESGLGGFLERVAYGWTRWGALLGWDSHLARCLTGTGGPGGWAWIELWEAAPGREAHSVTQQTSASRKG